MMDLIYLNEPQLLFRNNQSMEDPRDGLTLFGPLDESKPFGIRWGVIGTTEGITRFTHWVEKINSPIFDTNSDNQSNEARPPFLGFETIFRTKWGEKSTLSIEISESELYSYIYLEDANQRVYKTVELFSSKIIKAINTEEKQVDIWFVVIPDDVYKYCRPKSIVEADIRIKTKKKISSKVLQELKVQSSWLPDYQKDKVAPYYFEVNFHNQLKARLLKSKALTQIVRESTIAPWDFPDNRGNPARGMDKMQSSVAWNIATATFYKCGGRPWKINNIRDGVCYIGLVFKQLPENSKKGNACCAAQMFLDSGDGVVFKGNVGPWYNPEIGDYHLDRKSAKQLVNLAMESYKANTGKFPKELFLHGKVRFNNDEWNGFLDAVSNETNLVGVVIRESNDLKLFRKEKMPVLRGIGYIHSERKAYLWSKGYVPRIGTYAGRVSSTPKLYHL